MPNAAKVEVVTRIKDDLQASDAVWVVDYRGLTVKQTEELRGLVRAQNASLKVYKNSFTELALADLGMPSMNGILEGPSAFVFVSGDPVASAKVLKTFAKANDALSIKGGLLNGDVMSEEQVKAIADLPSREELIAKLLGTINNPLTGIVRVLNAVPQGLVTALDAVVKKAA
jgi:large subunit ribosomal protein L10